MRAAGKKEPLRERELGALGLLRFLAGACFVVLALLACLLLRGVALLAADDAPASLHAAGQLARVREESQRMAGVIPKRGWRFRRIGIGF